MTQQNADIAHIDSGAHELFPRADSAVLQCVHCDVHFDSAQDARRRRCVTFGAW